MIFSFQSPIVSRCDIFKGAYDQKYSRTKTPSDHPSVATMEINSHRSSSTYSRRESAVSHKHPSH
jgi:hypothetical protein